MLNLNADDHSRESMVRGSIKENAIDELLKELARPGQVVDGVEDKRSTGRPPLKRRGEDGLPCADLTCPCRVLRKGRT